MIGAEIRNLLKNSKGFTMLEMIITLMLTAIFFSGVVMILPTMTKSYNKIISLNYARQVATSVSEAVSEQLTYASDVNLIMEDKEQNIGYIYHGENRKIVLGKNGIIPGLVYDTDYYMDKDVFLTASMESSRDGKKVLRLVIEVFAKDSTDSAMKKDRIIRLYGI